MENIDIEVMFQKVLDSLPLFIFWKDRDCNYLGCNQSFADIAGLKSPAEIIGKNDVDLIWASQAEHFQTDDRFVMDNDRAKLNIIEEQIQPDGMHWLETNKIPIKNKVGDIIGVMGSFNDITEKVKLQEERIEQEKLETMTALAGGISHDLNNSLSIVSGLVQICQKTLEDEEALEMFPTYFIKMREGIQKSALLTKRFMNFSKEDSEEIKQIINLDNFFEDTLSLLKSGFSIQIEFESDNPLAYVKFDESQLSQVINNLILNAKQAMDDKGRVKVYTTKESIMGNPDLKDADYIRIDITDTGHGISEENIKNVFKSSFTTKTTGNGLGLASCLSIMKRHLGNIVVNSVVGLGTTFSLYIPEVSDVEVEEGFVFSRELVEGSGKIILVDDDDNLRQTTKRQLEHLGYEVIDYATGEDMLKSYKGRASCDLIITDYYLLDNHLNGDEICKKVKEVDSSMPILLLSGYFESTDKLKNFDYIMRKPHDLARLSQLLDRFILR